MKSRRQLKLTRCQRGITMVEALVALVVISVGMLGIAGLYLSSLQASRTAKLRSHAVELTSSIADRIRANRDFVANYSLAVGATPTAQDCASKRCTGEQLAQDDLALWLADVRAALPGADAVTGTIQVTDTEAPAFDNCLITVTWREANSDIDFTYSVSLNIANPT